MDRTPRANAFYVDYRSRGNGPPVVAFLGVQEGHRIGPSNTEGLDKALGLSVCAGRVRPGAVVLEAKGFAGLGKAS